MEVQKQNNKGQIALTIVLIIIILGLSGYIVYDKLLSNNTAKSISNDCDKTTTEEKKSIISESEALSIGNELWEYAYSTYLGKKPAWVNISHSNLDCDANNIAQIKEKYTTDFRAEFESGFDDNLEGFMNCSAGRGSDEFYKETNLRIKEIQENKLYLRLNLNIVIHLGAENQTTLYKKSKKILL